MTPAQAEAAAIDVGLRQYMLRVYNFMAAGLALTGIVAMVVASSPSAMALIFGTPIKWVVLFAPLGLAFYMGAKIESMRASTAQGIFWAFAALIGVMMSSYLMMYTGASVARVFFITAASFAGLSLYGYTTRKDLSGFGSFLIMGVWGLIIASVVNIFLQSSALHFAMSVIGVLVFAGLTAYDTQKIKELYWEADGAEVAAKKSILGALTLYMDFINIFIFLMQLMGIRRDE
ncbi:MAG: Bax inhibitor-1/YccA family protein [Magnetospirillum sp.]|nr:Bax inhibitor-1/YccA family protein [Magnetospirillum sp.]